MYNLLRNFFYLVFIIFFRVSPVCAHDVYLPVIIDTDGAADDMRAVAMLLNAGSVDVRLIVTSDGVLSPQKSKEAVQKLLTCLKKDGIPVVAGEKSGKPAPEFRKLNESLNWPECTNMYASKYASKTDSTDITASSAILSAINGSDDEFLYLSLGPMTNLAAALQIEPLIKKQLNRIVYIGGAPDTDNPGWNTRRDPESAKSVYSSGVSLYGLGLPNDQYPAFDDSMYQKISGADSETAYLLSKIHDFPGMRKKISENHTKIWDEMAVLYINRFSAFEF